MRIQDILTSLGIEFFEEGGHKHARPGWLQLDCPFCGPNSKRFHLGYNLRAGYFHCWRCRGHNPFVVLTTLGASRRDAKDFYDGREVAPGLEDRKRKGLAEPSGRESLEEQARCALYLWERGFRPEELIRLWSLEGIGRKGGRLAWRIYIPILYKDARVSWTSRAIGDKVQQRYISASAEEEAINHKHLIYGFDYCLHSIVIVEGPTDVWKVGPGAGGLFGTAFSSAQVRKLIKFPNRVICFDNSPEAQRRAGQLAEQLAPFPGRTLNIQLEADDPGSASKKEIKQLRKIAKLA